jgi:PAS domain S-box-containing protein
MGDQKEYDQIRNAALALCVLTILGLIAIEALGHYTDWKYGHASMLMVHLLMEMFAIIIAMLIVTVSWHTVDPQDQQSSSVLAFGFLIVAVCDLMHALSYKGMPPFLSERSTSRAIYFWLMGRTFEVTTMWLLAINWAPAWSRRSALLLSIAASAMLIWIGSFDLGIFPATFVDGQGVTPFKASYELVLCLLYIAVAAMLWRCAKISGQSRYYLLAASSFVMGVGEISFTSYAAPSDIQNIFGHMYKLVSYALLYQATFIVSVRTPIEVIRQTQKQLSESETRIRSLSDNLPNCMVYEAVWKAEGNWHFTYVGRAVEQINGLRAEDVVRDPMLLYSQILDEDKLLMMHAARQSIEKLENFDVIVRMRRSDGQLRWVQLRSAPRRIQDGAIVWDGVEIDITELKRAEAEQKRLQEQLMQSQKMESIGHLAGGIAHDFNNMLNAILGYAQLLKLAGAGTASSGDGRMQNYVDAILTTGNHAKDMIRQMLVFSRLKSGTGEEEQPLTLVAAALRESVSLLLPSIPDGIAVDLRFEGEGLKARAHPAQLYQILLNLVINARDAIDGQGAIGISLARFAGDGICHACNREFGGEYLELSVRDSGSGIPEHLLGKIFEPFFTTKPAGQGTGMGLSVVYGHVHDLGGHIRINSQVGQGTTIAILLPEEHEDAGSPDDVVPSGDAEVNRRIAGLRIMVVDDETAVSSMLGDLLSFHGAQALIFDRPGEALSAFERDPAGVDLVITDQNMPGLSGLEMAKSMLQLRPDLSVILCTGHSEHVDEVIAIRSGIAEFIYKPIDVNRLIESIVNSCFRPVRQRQTGPSTA